MRSSCAPDAACPDRPSGGPSGCQGTTAVRGRLVWFRDDPFLTSSDEALVYVDDGLLVCHDGKIVAAGDHGRLVRDLPPGVTVESYRDKLILPGLVGSHAHYVQVRIIAEYGEELLDWLRDYVYPEERRFADASYARPIAALFCDELLRNGTTTAMVHCATSPQSVDALFEESVGRGMRLVAGKVLMDRKAPSDVLDSSPEQAYEESRKLIERWHGVGRSVYAVTPRFAYTCSSEMLRVAGALWREHPGTLLQTHLAENRWEVAKVAELFPPPRYRDYVDVYEKHGLLGPGAVFAHAVHLRKREWERLHHTGSGVSHCPTSNLFLGSGLFRMKRAARRSRRVPVGLGSDVAGGTSLSLLQTASEAYKVGALRGYPMDGVKLFYLATVGSATAMRLDHLVGSLEPGHEADFVVLDPAATPQLDARTADVDSVNDLLFSLAVMGDDRAVLATYLAGRLAHRRDACPGPLPVRPTDTRGDRS
ncbi:guanine deaminase [Streptomyces paromomycinus]|uniref:Guanine deaminase n=1 Tax=Streptomyces paromomycinus TaxID=92743 RepID=A0A401W0L4_STREY|nr:guanine deaminase [Streptomyces paromomycinus]GCD42826.1 guanine deaminase [Streptomyces paromomycinus]